ncbi:MAG TPA: hypothetical protein VK673_12670 [Chthoniobacterales bacterium]|nr:hypothetical protein [Chthoniobacterales bacterium]
MLKLLSNLDAHQRALAALAVAFIVFLATFNVEHLPFRIILTWNAFALTGIFLAWSRILLADAKESVVSAKLQDTSRSIIFTTVLLGHAEVYSRLPICWGRRKAYLAPG